MKQQTIPNVMPCKNIAMEAQTFEYGKPTMVSIIDMHDHRTNHKMTKTPVTEIRFWPEGDIRELRTETGTYVGVRKINQFNHGEMPIAVVHYYNDIDGGIVKKGVYHLTKDLIQDLRRYYRENGNKDIMVYADHDDQLTIQRITNICLVYAGVRPAICSLRHAAATQDFDLA